MTTKLFIVLPLSHPLPAAVEISEAEIIDSHLYRQRLTATQCDENERYRCRCVETHHIPNGKNIHISVLCPFPFLVCGCGSVRPSIATFQSTCLSEMGRPLASVCPARDQDYMNWKFINEVPINHCDDDDHHRSEGDCICVNKIKETMMNWTIYR